MTKWISQIARKLGFHGSELGPPCIVLVRKDDLRLNLLEMPLECGHSGYRVDLEYLVEKPDTWVDVASLRDYNLEAAISLLREAQQCITNLHREE